MAAADLGDVSLRTSVLLLMVTSVS
jgi:hypothetical protein